MNKMKMFKKLLAGLVTGALAIGGFTTAAFNNLMPDSSITVSAATVYAPSLNGNNYIIGYCITDSSVPVYTDSSLKTRGASKSKWGSASAYNAYISGNVDEIKIYSINGSVCYAGYPAGKSTKYGYISTSAVTSFDGASNGIKSQAKVNVYKKSNLSSYYGYADKGDTVYTLCRSGSNYKIIYNISGGNWKTGWVSQSSYNSIIGQAVDNTTYIGYVNTSSQPLNLRSKAQTGNNVIASMPKGSAVTVLDGKRQTNGFYRVSYNNKTGYASAQYISFSKPNPQKTPTVFSQTDSRWGSYGYGYSDTAGTKKTNIYNAGCGLLSLTNAVYYLNGQFINPTILADYSLRNGYRINGVGTSAGLYKSFADNRGGTYGIAYNGSSSSYYTLRTHLQAGEVAIGSAPNHLMAIVAYDSSNGKYLILDSYKSSNRDTYATGYTWKTESQCRNIYKLNFSSFYFIKRR